MNNSKKILKKLCPPLLWDFLKTLKNKSNGKYYGQNQLDEKIETFVNFDNGFFVELGANDGINQSNTYYFEKYRGWNGVLIEPIGQKYLECIKNRSNKNKIFCNACVSFDYDKKFVEMTYSDLMTISNIEESNIKSSSEHIQVGMKYLQEGEKSYNFGCIADTLNNILLKSNAPKKIDFLSLDVEGAELEVLKGVDFDEFSFKFMLIEVRDIKRLENFLNQHGYILEKKFSSHDYLFKRVH